MVWMFASRYLAYFQKFKNILWKITLSFISDQWAIHCHQKALTEDLTCKNIHSDPQGLPTVFKTQFYLSTENMKYLKSFQGTQGYQGRKCIRRKKKPHISILEVNKDGGGPEAQHLLLSTIISRHLQSQSSYGLCWSVKDPGAIRQASWWPPEKKSSLQAHTAA